jgi:bifunctional DNA-binding transcriptional regulator/antitoxin component of YhaV-PrlF toxin-antitoxin module
MSEVAVTRGSQITLTKKVREEIGVEEGDIVTVNVSGDQAIITKKDPEAFDEEGFLPKNFDEIVDRTRKDSTERLDELME